MKDWIFLLLNTSWIPDVTRGLFCVKDYSIFCFHPSPVWPQRLFQRNVKHVCQVWSRSVKRNMTLHQSCSPLPSWAPRLVFHYGTTQIFVSWGWRIHVPNLVQIHQSMKEPINNIHTYVDFHLSHYRVLYTYLWLLEQQLVYYYVIMHAPYILSVFIWKWCNHV